MSDYVNWYGAARHQDWRTPPSIFDPLNEEFRFDLDGAATEGNSLLNDASTPENPVPWNGRRVFCNPPWSNIAPFIDEAVLAQVAVLLVPARTNARWFHHALDMGAEVRFFLGRPSFIPNDPTTKVSSSPVDCVFLVFGMP